MSNFDGPDKKVILGRAITEVVDSEDLSEDLSSGSSAQSSLSDDQIGAPSDFR